MLFLLPDDGLNFALYNVRALIYCFMTQSCIKVFQSLILELSVEFLGILAVWSWMFSKKDQVAALLRCTLKLHVKR